ncbi:rhodanese-like domain-containing protein, partial [Acidocella sp.]|uniref:rhodanese-like domain-containing protein n=1 Tax=Acidocella sp. TaxID=50710 RepID=UPI00262A276B
MPRSPKTRLSTLLRLIPALPVAVAAVQPLAAARAATPDQPSLDALAQMVARGDDMVSVDYLKARILAARGDFTLIDIRAPDEFAAGHIKGAVNLTVPQLLSPDEVVKLRRMPQVILYGTNSAAAAQAAVLLRLSGVAAMALSGGVQAWASTLQAAPASLVRELKKGAVFEPRDTEVDTLTSPGEPWEARQASGKKLRAH